MQLNKYTVQCTCDCGHHRIKINTCEMANET